MLSVDRWDMDTFLEDVLCSNTRFPITWIWSQAVTSFTTNVAWHNAIKTIEMIKASIISGRIIAYKK